MHILNIKPDTSRAISSQLCSIFFHAHLQLEVVREQRSSKGKGAGDYHPTAFPALLI